MMVAVETTVKTVPLIGLRVLGRLHFPMAG